MVGDRGGLTALRNTARHVITRPSRFPISCEDVVEPTDSHEVSTLGKVVVTVSRGNQKLDSSMLWQGCCSGVVLLSASLEQKQRTSASERYVSVSIFTTFEETESESDQD
jgi:hypothetical protein